MPKRIRRIIYLDNDETLGYWIPLIRLYTFLFDSKAVKYESDQHKEECKKIVQQRLVKYKLMDNYCRPKLREFLRFLYRMKQRQDVHEVSMFTAASDESGWVSFLKDLLEVYAGTPNLYDNVFTVEEVAPELSTKTGKKHIDAVSNFLSREVIFIDDRCNQVVHTDYPYNVHMFNVVPYFLKHDEHRDYKMFKKCCKGFHFTGKIPSYKGDARLKNENTLDTSDRALVYCMSRIRSMWSTKLSNTSQAKKRPTSRSSSKASKTSKTSKTSKLSKVSKTSKTARKIRKSQKSKKTKKSRSSAGSTFSPFRFVR